MLSHGVYLDTGSDAGELVRVGPFAVAAHGPLAELELAEDLAVAFEGVVYGSDGQDARRLAAAYREGGVAAARKLLGSFRAVIIDRRTPEPVAVLVTDAFATRPVFVYQGRERAALAPSPLWFAERKLPCSFDREGFYQVCRVLHPIGARSTVREIHKARPMRHYRIDPSGEVSPSEPPRIEAAPDPAIDHVTAADLIHATMSKVVRELTEHPKLARRPISLPLTSGMDSRHILACLLEQGRAPAEITHVRTRDVEYEPVAEMARALDLPLRSAAVAELPLAELAQRWLRETAGMAHFHQLYLLGVGGPSMAGRALGFDGYLAGFLFGFYLLPRPLSQRVYSPKALQLIFPDHRDLEAQCRDAVAEEETCWQGSANFVRRGLDIHNRGPGYTSAIFPILAGMDAFSPTAHPEALDVYRRIPEHIGAGKRARLALFRRHYPELGRFRSEFGESYSVAQRVGPGRAHAARDALDFVLGMIPGLGRDPAPGTAHEWLRTIAFYRRALDGLARDSMLARDNHVSSRWLRALWAYEKSGGFVGWMLMGLLSAEVSYRLLVEQSSLEEVSTWLCGA